MNERDLLDRAAKHVHKELEQLGGNPMKLDIRLQTVAVVYHVQAMVDNGGFRYLFESNFPFCPPYSLFSDAYRRIGAVDAADHLDKAVSMFPFANPHQLQQERNDFMDSLDESHEMFELGDRVCGNKAIWIALENYVKKNVDAFLVM